MSRDVSMVGATVIPEWNPTREQVQNSVLAAMDWVRARARLSARLDGGACAPGRCDSPASLEFVKILPT